VLAWWLTLKPSNDGNWQPDSARTARAEIDGDHNSQFTQLRLSHRNRLRELALRWCHLHADRINIEKRVYEGKFDDVKTDAGEREVPFDKRELMKSALIGRWNASQHRQADDLVFSTHLRLQRRNHF
jgi:hypothetical protein